jgi:hypothetical protein
MAEFLLTNHDGDIFYRKPSEWPVAEPADPTAQ